MNLNASLDTAVQSLMANTGALQATNNNIANVDTPGYTREVVELQSAAPDSTGLGNGVVLEGYQSVRDELLQTQIEQQTQAQSGANAQLNSLQQVQTTFTTSSNDIGTQMSALFSSITDLETDPTDSSLRQSVLTAGQNLATAFNTASSSLTTTQTGLNTQVSQDVTQINQLTAQIAALNPEIAADNANGKDAGTVQDQQDQLVLSLSKLTNVSITNTESGVTLSTGSGTPLVVGAQSFALQAATGNNGLTHVFDSNGTDITSTISSGDLGGTIQTRDQTIAGLQTQLNTLASQFAQAFNSAQTQGYDSNGNAGTNFFNVSSSTSGAAASISVALTDPSQLAASSDGTSGSDGNLANFTAVQSTKLASGSTPTDAYAGLIYQVGTVMSTATAESNATTANLQSLNDQLSSVSGVSVDEESTNLIRYQQAYEAAARVVSTINSLFSVTMSMGTSAAE